MSPQRVVLHHLYHTVSHQRSPFFRVMPFCTVSVVFIAILKSRSEGLAALTAPCGRRLRGIGTGGCGRAEDESKGKFLCDRQ